MPSPITKYIQRTWCKHCNNFTLHDYAPQGKERNMFGDLLTTANDPLVCGECETVFTEVLLSEIPSDKIKQQRERYKNTQRNQFDNSINSMLNAMSVVDPFLMFKEQTPSVKTEIIESDAGWKQERQKEIQKERDIRTLINAELQKFKHVGRNDICLCGSGLKYKRCCLPKHNINY